MSTITLRRSRAARGFTLIEMLVVLGILGIFLVVSYPSIMNTLAVRNLENATRQVQTFLQQAKLLAVSTKIVHRVRFYQPEGTYWAYDIQRLEADGTWAKALGAPPKAISDQFTITLNLPKDGPDPIIVFSPYGTVENFTTGQNTLVLQSPKLDRPNQMDERVLSVFMGGSIEYAKRKST